MLGVTCGNGYQHFVIFDSFTMQLSPSLYVSLALYLYIYIYICNIVKDICILICPLRLLRFSNVFAAK